MLLGKSLKKLEGEWIKMTKKGEIRLRGIFQVFRSSAHHPFLPDSLPLGSCVLAGIRGWWLGVYKGAGLVGTRGLVTTQSGYLTPAALRLREAQTCWVFLQPSIRRVLFLCCLGTYALIHDVGDLRQWAPRRDFIRFWRYVDCNIQQIYGAPFCCQ